MRNQRTTRRRMGGQRGRTAIASARRSPTAARAEFLAALKERLASYAPLPAAPPPAFLAAPADATALRCDRCAIDLPTYYRDFPQDAWILAYFREDGTLGSVCHRCAGGWS